MRPDEWTTTVLLAMAKVNKNPETCKRFREKFIFFIKIYLLLNTHHHLFYLVSKVHQYQFSMINLQ